MPLLIGGAGEKVMPGIVARQADEWNVWGTPELFARKNTLITQACEAIGRDPATLRRSTQALVVLGRDPVPEDGARAITPTAALTRASPEREREEPRPGALDSRRGARRAARRPPPRRSADD